MAVHLHTVTPRSALLVAVPALVAAAASATPLAITNSQEGTAAALGAGLLTATGAAIYGDRLATASAWMRASPAFGVGIGLLAGGFAAWGLSNALHPAPAPAS